MPIPSLEASGTKAIQDTDNELDLATTTTPGTYQLVIDVNALPNDEELIIREYQKVLSGGTERLSNEWHLHHAQGLPIYYAPPVAIDIHLRYSLEIIQPSSTSRSFPWKILDLIAA